MGKLRPLLSFLSVPYLLSVIVDARTGILEVQVSCEVDLSKFIEFSDNQKCLQIALNEKLESSCVSVIHRTQSLTLQMRSHKYLQFRDIDFVIGKNCQTFLIFAKSLEDLREIFNFDQSNNKLQFFPYTKIYFYISDHLISPDSLTKLRTFLTENTLFGYVFEQTMNEENKVIVRDLLTNSTRQPIFSYTPSDLFHPMVDTRFAKYNFTISLFSCAPFTSYPEGSNDSMWEWRISIENFFYSNVSF